MVKIKICGITNTEDYQAALDLEVDFTGFIFYPKSPRFIRKELAARILSQKKDSKNSIVGVFVNEEIEKIQHIYDYVSLDIVQLHGDETPEYCKALSLPYWKAIHVKDVNSLKALKQFDCEVFVLDTFSPTQYGGTGHSFDWKLAQTAIQSGKKIIVSGGISISNIKNILEFTPFAVDINSSIEDRPGKKNIKKMKALVQTIRNTRPENDKKKNHKKNRYFGPYGGRYVPEMLIPALDELASYYESMKEDPEFQKELIHTLKTYAGRPSPLYYAENLTRRTGGCRIYLKMESLNHTGSHKINNAVGQVLLAKKMGKTHLIAETGAGQHGLAVATVAAKFKLSCRIFMGEKDVKRQHPNVFGMKLLGADVIPVSSGTMTLKDAVNEALKYWIEHLENTYYLLGSVVGPHPYPLVVRDFQSIIGKEVKQQILERENRLPDFLVACVGGGSNALGLFHPFLKHKEIDFFGVEAGGTGPGPGNNAIRFTQMPETGIAQGYRSFFLQDEQGQILPTHSVGPGLDYAGVGPELAYLFDRKRIQFSSVSDREALDAYRILSEEEGIIPALESAHAVAFALKMAPERPKDSIMVVNLSGRGDKDIFLTAKKLAPEDWIDFLKSEVKDE